MSNVHDYAGIINLPHHTSQRHPRMPQLDRAAQFAPFAALSGYNEAIKETARQTEDMIELSADEAEKLNRTLDALIACGFECDAEIKYFEPDEKKKGGKYLTYRGRILRIDEYKKELIMTDGKKIAVERIADIVI